MLEKLKKINNCIMKSNLSIIYVVMLTLASQFYGCIDDPRDRFKNPPWLGGTNIETLEKDGNYTQFLALMDKAEYRISIENQLFALFVPNDSSFEAYFKSKGINSVDNLSKDEAEELFGQHILVNPRSREQLMYEYEWNELQDTGTEYATLFHRKKTYSVPIDYVEKNVPYNATFKDQDVRIYRSNTYVPLFTTEYFEDYFGDPAGSDYLFMYPGSSWSGTQWHDAMVESIGRTSSGFIYFIDRVVAPIPTIDKYLLEDPDDFSLFYDIAQRFAVYTDKKLTEDKTGNRYRKGYNSKLNMSIGDERGPSGGGDEPNRVLYMYSAFIPYNNVLQEYLDNTVFSHGYTTLDSVPELFLIYLLQSHVIGFLELPSKIDKRFVNYYGDEIDIDINTDIKTSKMCSNGIIYGMNRILAPNIFTCAPGPIFYNKDYTTFLYALDQSGDVNSLADIENDVTLFASNNQDLMDYGIRTNEDDNNNIIIEIRTAGDVWVAMKSEELKKFVRNYYHYGKYDDFNGEGYIRMASNNYVYYKDGKIYGGGNQVLGDYSTVVEKIESNKNGNLFYLNNSINKPYNAAQLILNDPDLSSFAALLDTAGLITMRTDVHDDKLKYPEVIFMPSLDQWTVLAPTNQAIADAEVAGLVPNDIEKLKKFLYYHFIRSKAIFDDGQFSGTVSTQRIDTITGSDITYETLNFTNAVYNLSVQDNSGKVVSINHNDADRLIETGVLHKITTVLAVP